MIDMDMSMSDLAKELNITRAYLTEIFKGTRKATGQKQKIARILGLDYIKPAS